MEIPAPKRQRTSMFDVNNIYSNSYPFNYPHRGRYQQQQQQTDELQSLSIRSISSLTGILSFLDEQSLNKLKQTSNKMGEITNEYVNKYWNNIYHINHRSFIHHTDDQEFALNNVELDEDIDIDIDIDINDTRNYNTSVSNTLSPLSCLHAPSSAPSLLLLSSSLDNFNLNTNKLISNKSSNYHSTIIGHRINEYNEDGNEDKDMYDQNRYSVLNILDDIQQFSL